MFKFLKEQKLKKANYANPTKRFLAYSIDNFILVVIRYILGLILVITWYSKSFMLFANDYSDLVRDGQYDPRSTLDFFKYFITQGILYETIFLFLILFSIGSIYWIVMPATRFGGTIGKIIFKLKIVNEKNKTLSLKESMFRYLVGLIPWGFHVIVIISIFAKNIVLLLLAVLLVTFWYEPRLIRRSYLAVHDLICNTKVINAEGNKTTKK